MIRRLLTSAICGAVLIGSPSAHADDDAARKALLDEAVAARAANDHARALSLAEAALAKRATASLLLFVAQEHEQLAHFPEAYDAGRDCLRLSESEPPSPTHDGVLLACRAIVADIRPRVAVVGWEVPSPRPEGLVVSIAGKVRDATRRSVAVAPGSVRVDARAPGWMAFTSTIDVAAGADANVTIALVREPVAPQPISAKPHKKSLVGPILAGVGVAALATAGVLFLVANKDYASLKEDCDPRCPKDALDRQTSIERLDWIARGTAVVGLGLVATGITLFVLDRPNDKPATMTGTWIDAGPLGVTLRGRF
jgi:hypothetical protein